MSRGHSGSRRRNYGPRQRDIRRRAPHAAEPDTRTIEWPRGAAWADASGAASELVTRTDREEVA
ncbi:MAG: hypothetical protein M3472_01960 [Chloroflexota bacterium]|nr:hypothetical protein [Chloroflexota bacterium]